MPDQPPSSSDLQQKYRQFLDLLPLTITLAGLPPSESRLFGEEQIEARAITFRAAYRVARNGRERMPGRIVRPLPVASADAVGILPAGAV